MGAVERIVEQKDANSAEAAICECNSGFYCFDARALFEALSQVNDDNAQGEFYLTDVLAICRAAGRPVLALRTDDLVRVPGRELARPAGRGHEARCSAASTPPHLAAGVTMTDPDQVWIGPDVVIEQDVELLPQTFLMGTHVRGRGQRDRPELAA